MLSHDNFSLKESSCCVGGVDFITLVRIFLVLKSVNR